MSDSSLDAVGSSPDAAEPNGSLRVLVVDDHPAIRSALVDTVAETMDMSVCGEAKTAAEAFQMVETLRPHIAIVDISLKDANGVALIEKIHTHYPDVKMVVYSTHDETVHAERAIRAGVSGYVMKGEPTKRLIEAIRAVRRGEIYLSRRMATRVLGGRDPSSGLGFFIDELTGRELKVLQLFGKGYDADERADALDLNQETVETYRRQAKEKLGLGSVSELQQYALRWTMAQRRDD